MKVTASRGAAAGHLIIFCVIGATVTSGMMNTPGPKLLLYLVVPLGVVLIELLKKVLDPPCLEVKQGQFRVEGLTPSIECAAANVADIWLERNRLCVLFRDTSAVSPRGKALESNLEKTGSHIAYRAPSFPASDVDRFRRALGLDSLPAEAPRTPTGRFYEALEGRVPLATVTVALILLNVVVFVTMIAAGVSPWSPDVVEMVTLGANYGPRTARGEWWRLLSSMFLHFGLIHAFFNLWVLLGIGALVERLVGSLGFAVAYVLSGVVGSFAAYLVHPGVVSAGASGAIFGLFGVLLAYSLVGAHAIPASALRELRASGLGFLVMNFLVGSQMEGIDWAAHLGGLLCGMVCGLFLGAADRLGDSRRARLMSGGALAVLGAIAVCFCIRSSPQPPDDYLQALDSFAQAETRILTALSAAEAQLENGTLSKDGFATALEQEGIAPWLEQQQILANLSGVPDEVRARLQGLFGYMSLRKESWESLARGFREDDESLLEEAAKKGDAAAEMARRFLEGK